MLHAMHVHAHKQMNIMRHAYIMHMHSPYHPLRFCCPRFAIVVASASARGEKKDRPDLQARSGATGSAGRAVLLPARRAVSVHRDS